MGYWHCASIRQYQSGNVEDMTNQVENKGLFCSLIVSNVWCNFTTLPLCCY